LYLEGVDIFMTLIITMYDNNDEIIEELFANDWQSFAEMMEFYFNDREYFRFEIVKS
jgi:hypothetical protein